jgi:hypothetical protein
MGADAATVVVMNHDPVADLGCPRVNALANRDDDTAWLMTADHGLGLAEAESLGNGTRRRAIELQVAAAHAGRLNLQHHLAGARRILQSTRGLKICQQLTTMLTP